MRKKQTQEEKLDRIARRDNITLLETDCRECGSLSVLVDGKCYVGIDENACGVEKTVFKAHEMGHCEKGAFYNRYSPFDIISRHEAAADRWAIETLVPEDELIEAFKKEINTPYLLAEYFEVSEEFMVKVCKYYGYYFEAI